MNITNPRILPARAGIAKFQHYLASIRSADCPEGDECWCHIKHYIQLYRKEVRGSAKPQLEALVMQPSFTMLCSWGALGYVHDWLTSSVTNDSSLKLC